MTVGSNYVIAIVTLSDWLKRLALVFQPMRSKTKTNRVASELEVISRNCDWFIALFAPVVIGRSNCFGFGVWTVIWKPLSSDFTGADPGILDRGVQTLTQKTLFSASYRSSQLRHSSQQHYNQFIAIFRSPLTVVDMDFNSKGYTSGASPLLLGYKCCTDVVNIYVKVMVQAHECKSWQSLLRH